MRKKLVFMRVSRLFAERNGNAEKRIGGLGNNPMVGATVAVAVAVEEALKA